MATWKKVVVSGSDISQLNNDAGYLTSVTAQNAFATASVNGVNLLANGANGTLTFASSSGAGLRITGNSGTDTITFTLTSIPNSSLENSTISGVSLGSNLANLTAGNGISSTGTYNGSTARTFSVDPDSETGGDIQPVNVTANGVGLDIQAIAGNGLSADGSANLDVNAGLGISIVNDTVTVNTSSAHFTNGVVAGLPSGTISGSSQVNYGQITGVPSGIVSASSLSSPAQGQVTLTTNGVAQSATSITSLTTGGSPQFVNLTLTGDAAVNGGDITTTAGTFNLVNTNATTINFGGAAGTINIGNGTSTTNIADNLVVVGDLTVQGTTTSIQTANLNVEDQFILLNSGSATGDGGIIVQTETNFSGQGLGWKDTSGRWGLEALMPHNDTAINPKNYLVSVSQSTLPPVDGNGSDYGGTSFGYGNMHITTGGDIYIFS